MKEKKRGLWVKGAEGLEGLHGGWGGAGGGRGSHTLYVIKYNVIKPKK